MINDFSRDLGEVSWDWELLLGRRCVAQGGGEAEVPKDSVVGLGEAKAKLLGTGPAVLSLRLSGGELSISNEYRFRVS